MVLTMTGREARGADFADWVAAREPWLQRTAHLLTGDVHDARDLVQVTLTKLYLRWDRLTDHGNLDGYARQVLLNEARTLWRRPWWRREQAVDELPVVPLHEPGYDGLRDAVWQWLAGLPPRQRAVLVLRYYEQLTETETAEALGISVGTVKSTAHRALAQLRAHADEHPEIIGEIPGEPS